MDVRERERERERDIRDVGLTTTCNAVMRLSVAGSVIPDTSRNLFC